MKVAGGLNYVTGPMGAGKSLYGVRRIVAQVIAGSYAVTNVELLPGWSERVAWHVATWRGRRKRAAVAARRRASVAAACSPYPTSRNRLYRQRATHSSREVDGARLGS